MRGEIRRALRGGGLSPARAGRIAALALACAAVGASAAEAWIHRDGAGRFVAEARIGAHRVDVEVVPGEHHVLVPTAAARRIGARFERTAGRRERVLGRDVLAFPTRLPSVRLGAVALANVPALVVDDRRVRYVTLGRPFLGRLDSVLVSRRSVVLVQRERPAGRDGRGGE